MERRTFQSFFPCFTVLALRRRESRLSEPVLGAYALLCVVLTWVMASTIPIQTYAIWLLSCNTQQPLRKIPLPILLLLSLTLSLLLFPPWSATACVANVVAREVEALSPLLCIAIIRLPLLPLLKIPSIRI